MHCGQLFQSLSKYLFQRRLSLGTDMRRRDFITLIGGAAAWPLAARAAGKRPRVAVLTLLSVHDERGRIAAFVGGMQELGYVARGIPPDRCVCR